MTDINKTHDAEGVAGVRRLDGNLLLVFREVLRSGSATSAARRLHVSQSAISHALMRLRDVLGDDLFVRRPHGLEPTRRARELAPRIDAIIDLLAATVGGEAEFEPARTTRRFQVAAPEFFWAQYGGALLKVLNVRAPGASLVMHALRGDPRDLIVRGELDAAVGRFGTGPDAELEAVDLYEEHYCVVARRAHPQINATISLAQYCEIGHVFAGLRGNEGPWEPIPEARDVRTLAFAPDWVVALTIVAGSNAITTCPTRLARAYAGRLRLQMLEPPWPAPSFAITCVTRVRGGPAVAWLRGLVTATCQGN